MKAPPVLPGSRIGVVAPGSAPLNPDRLSRGIARLRALGFEVEMDPPEVQAHGYLAGSDAERIASFNRMLKRTDITALFCVRGGYGCLRMLPFIEYAVARSNPKLLVGYSDITALHMAMYERAGWVGLQGPMVAVEWHEAEPDAERLFWDLASNGWTGLIEGPDGERLTGVKSGFVDGTLLGGNLAVLTSLVGSPYLPSLDGAILFLEDISEPPYRIDGYLARLQLSGILGRLGGLVFGAFTGWEPTDDSPTLSYQDVIDHYAQFVHGPVAKDLVFGHFPRKNTLPVGVGASLDVIDDHAELVLKESITS